LSYQRVLERLKKRHSKRLGGKVNVLLLHDSPWPEKYAGMIARDERGGNSNGSYL
jgi:hypothetical protein